MNGQYFEERSNTSDIVGRADTGTNSPVVTSDTFAGNVPLDATLIHDMPMGGGSVAAVGPMDVPVADEVPMYQTPVQNIPLSETVAPVSPIYQTVVPEAPMSETIHYTAVMGETIVDESQASMSTPYMAPKVEPAPYEAHPGSNAGPSAALLNRDQSEHFRTHWNEIQGMFVDDPRSAVQQADALVSEVVEQITQMFASEHTSLETQWKQGNDVSTEDLRKALQHYRSFFNRLVV
ncbi:MAG TPA: hypothetical protein VKF38_08205 [Anaerolineaceae bacterium]|nr:hypothetical protein [Anaerolineaceae bacterium]